MPISLAAAHIKPTHRAIGARRRAVVYDARSGTLTPPLIEQATVEASEPTAEPVCWRRTGGKHREVMNAQEKKGSTIDLLRGARLTDLHTSRHR